VANEALEILFSAEGRKVGDLGLEGQDHVGTRLHNVRTKLKGLVLAPLHVGGKATGFWVKAHAKEGLMGEPGVAQLVKKIHRRSYSVSVKVVDKSTRPSLIMSGDRAA
jgi:hypothetical protein